MVKIDIFLKLKDLSQEPLDQYKAYLYSLECIFRTESNYGNNILNDELFEKKFENFRPGICTRCPRGEG